MKNLFITWDGDSIGAKIGIARLNNDVEGCQHINAQINDGNKIFTDFATNNLGRTGEAAGDEGFIIIPADKLPEIPPLSAQYHQVTGCTVTIGVGFTLAESSKALLVGKLQGKDCIVTWLPEMQQIIDEAVAHPISEKDKEVQAYLGQEDTDHLEKTEFLKKRYLDETSGYSFTHEDPNTVQRPASWARPGEFMIPGAANHTVRAHYDGKNIGFAHFAYTPDGMVARNVFVDESHRRKGVASAMYSHAENKTNRKIVPSKRQTPEGKKLWSGNNANKQFGTDLAKAADPADIQQRLEPQVPKSKPHAPKLKSMNMGDNDEQPPINHEEEFHKIAQQQNAKDLHEKANSKEKLAQIKEGVVQTLNNIRQQLPDIAQLKQTAPDAYNSIVELTQRVVELGQITMKQMPKTNKSETLAKAISTLPPGKRLSAELKPHPTANGAKVFKRTVDYSHLLPEHVRNTGFQLHVEHKNVMLPKGVKSIPTSMTSPNIRPVGPSETIRSILKAPDNKEVGYVIGHVYDKKRGKAIEPHSDLDAPYRGKGLGTAMYEAAYAHAKNTGVNRVEGGVHSKDAHALHTRLAQKHGFHYRSNMWLDPKTKEPDEYFPYKPYSYALKSESFVENEDGFLGIGHGPIFYRDGVEMQKDEPKPEATEGQPRRMGANSGGAQAGRAHQNLPIGTMLNQKVKIINGVTGLANWRSVKGGTIASQQHNPPILGANSTPTSANNPDR